MEVDVVTEAVAMATAGKTPVSRLLGAHMPTSGGLHKSVVLGNEIGCTAVQIFTSSPRQWNASPLKDEDIAAFKKAMQDVGITVAVAHDSYLINLAAPAEDILSRSQKAFRSELDRAEQLGLRWVVTHMGAHLDKGEDDAYDRLIASLKQILEETDTLGYNVGIAMETTAGQGTGLGWRFEQLGRVLKGIGPHPRLGVCMDTCHIFAAGYDIRSKDAYEATIAEFDREIGLDRLKLIHANDAKKPLGSRVDRHEHIGKGEIGPEAFARLVTDPRLLHIPIIVETPDSETMHPVNVKRLNRLAAGQEMEMKVTLHLFGHYSDIFGGEPLEMEIHEGATVSDLAALLAQRDSRLAEIEKRCRFAINEEYVGLDTALTEGCTVAALPPMSGG